MKAIVASLCLLLVCSSASAQNPFTQSATTIVPAAPVTVLNGLQVPHGTTAQRPATPLNWTLYGNDELGLYQVYNGSTWLNFQPYSANLTTYSGITPSANVQTLLGAADYAAFKTSLSLVPGMDVQAFDQQLTDVAGLSYGGNALKVIRVNAGETGLELGGVGVLDGDTLTTGLTFPYHGLEVAQNGTAHTLAFSVNGLTANKTIQLYTGDMNTVVNLPVLNELSNFFSPTSASSPQIVNWYEQTTNGSNKISFTAPASIAADRTVTLPDASGTMVYDSSSQTLTNKTISGASNTITNVSLSTGVTGTLPVANGGTGGTTAATGRNGLNIYSSIATADQSWTSSATLSLATEMVVGVPASERVAFEAWVPFTCNASGGVRCRPNCTNASSMIYRVTIYNDSASPVASTRYTANSGATTATSFTQGFIKIEGSCVNNGTAGQVQILLGQSSSNASATTMQAGAWLKSWSDD